MMPWLQAQCAFITYESHVLFALRFMVDCNVVGGGWVELPAGKYQVTPRTLSGLHEATGAELPAVWLQHCSCLLLLLQVCEACWQP